MVDGRLDGIARELRVPPGELAFLADVDDATLARLQAALVGAREHQERALRDAFEGTLGVLPRAVRGRVRRLLVRGR